MNGSLRLSVVFAAVLRTLALYWIFNAVLMLLMLGSVFTSLRYGSFSSLFSLVPSCLEMVLAMLTWIFAGRIAELVIGAADVEFQAPQLEAAHLYTLGFVVVGLFFFINYLPGVVRCFYEMTEQDGPSKSLVTYVPAGSRLKIFPGDPIIPCVMGAVCAGLAPKWGKRVARAYAKANVELH